MSVINGIHFGVHWLFVDHRHRSNWLSRFHDIFISSGVKLTISGNLWRDRSQSLEWLRCGVLGVSSGIGPFWDWPADILPPIASQRADFGPLIHAKNPDRINTDDPNKSPLPIRIEGIMKNLITALAEVGWSMMIFYVMNSSQFLKVPYTWKL